MRRSTANGRGNGETTLAQPGLPSVSCGGRLSSATATVAASCRLLFSCGLRHWTSRRRCCLSLRDQPGRQPFPMAHQHYIAEPKHKGKRKPLDRITQVVALVQQRRLLADGELLEGARRFGHLLDIDWFQLVRQLLLDGWNVDAIPFSPRGCRWRRWRPVALRLTPNRFNTQANQPPGSGNTCVSWMIPVTGVLAGSSNSGQVCFGALSYGTHPRATRIARFGPSTSGVTTTYPERAGIDLVGNENLVCIVEFACSLNPPVSQFCKVSGQRLGIQVIGFQAPPLGQGRVVGDASAPCDPIAKILARTRPIMTSTTRMVKNNPLATENLQRVHG